MKRSSWLISLRAHLAPAGGGVQLCTQEYIDLLQNAGCRVEPKPYDIDLQPMARLSRAATRRAFRNHIPDSFVRELLAAAPSERPAFIFFNQVDSAAIVDQLAPIRSQGCRFVLLSHGAKIVDELILAREKADESQAGGLGERWRLGDLLMQEAAIRSAFDHVFCLSEEECVFERWLGSRSVSWVPRTIRTERLDWKPIAGRIGFVGTLDHAPNRRGLISFLDSFRSGAVESSIRIRVVGGPASAGIQLAASYPFVDYLGSLSDAELAQEAAGWCCFLHPLFDFARGASTKLAVALGWGLPVLTTTAGRRGYHWSEGRVEIADSPEQFARQARLVADCEFAAGLQENVILAARSSPTTQSVAAEMARQLNRCASS